MSVVGVTDVIIVVGVLAISLLAIGFYNYLSSSCTLYLTGESFSISNCPINSDLANLVREQRELLSCNLR